MTDISQQLKDVVGSRLKEHESMGKHTHFKIGGPARWYVEAKTEEEVRAVLQAATDAGVPWVINGGGSNVLYADAGFAGVVVSIAMRDVLIDGMRVTAGAGALSSVVARKTAEAGLAGLSWMISLPGTVGGAVRGNAGCFGGETKERLGEVRGATLDVGRWTLKTIAAKDLAMRYRHSRVKEEPIVIVSATFELEKGDRAELLAELDRLVAARKATQPSNVGSAGCVFKNAEVSDEDLARIAKRFDVPEAMRASHRVAAGWIIDRLDLKGTKVGAAQVSDKHGNFVINTGGATADEVLQLVGLLKTRVRNELGIQLQEEIQYIY